MARRPKKPIKTIRVTPVATKQAPVKTKRGLPTNAKRAPAKAEQKSPTTARRMPTKVERKIHIGSPVNPQRYKDFKPSDSSKQPAEELRLSEYIAAVRREVEAVALIAAPQDNEVPNFHVTEVELELVCAVSEVSDDGVLVTVTKDKLADLPEFMLQKIKVRMSDPAVIQLQNSVGPKK